MEFLYIVGFFALIYFIITQVEKHKAAVEARVDEQARALCGTCVFAHIACGFNDRQVLIACTFGGTARQLKFPVSACTLYCNRAVVSGETVRVAGFARDAGAPDALVAAKSAQ